MLCVLPKLNKTSILHPFSLTPYFDYHKRLCFGHRHQHLVLFPINVLGQESCKPRVWFGFACSKLSVELVGTRKTLGIWVLPTAWALPIEVLSNQ